MARHSACKNWRWSAIIRCWHSCATLAYELAFRNLRLRRHSSSNRCKTWISITNAIIAIRTTHKRPLSVTKKIATCCSHTIIWNCLPDYHRGPSLILVALGNVLRRPCVRSILIRAKFLQRCRDFSAAMLRKYIIFKITIININKYTVQCFHRTLAILQTYNFVTRMLFICTQGDFWI